MNERFSFNEGFFGDLKNKIMGKNFTKQERKIIWLYYFEDLSMKEISDIVKLSESRVSQMHGDIRARLQQKAARNPDYFSDIWSMMSQFKEAATAA
jgi:DNA-binding transcriptional regulator LsrR (DeoR family)